MTALKSRRPRQPQPPIVLAAIPMSLQAKLAAIVVHADEYLSPNGHEVDKTTIQNLVVDPEVVAWVESLGPLAPVKRNK